MISSATVSGSRLPDFQKSLPQPNAVGILPVAVGYPVGHHQQKISLFQPYVDILQLETVYNSRRRRGRFSMDT